MNLDPMAYLLNHTKSKHTATFVFSSISLPQFMCADKTSLMGTKTQRDITTAFRDIEQTLLSSKI